MPLKVMVFMDGSWFYHSRQSLFTNAGEDGFEIDYKRMTVLLQSTIADTLDQDVDLVKVCYFGTLPANRPGCNPTKQKVFYNFLAEQCGFCTEIAQVDARESSANEDRGVGVALTVKAMHFAAIPGVYDLAVIIGGSHEYRALCQGLHMLGKRTMLVAVRNSGNTVLTSPSLLSEAGVSDLPIFYLDDHLEELKLVRSEQLRTCKLCGAQESTTWAGPEFFCSKCRTVHRKRVRVCDTCGREEETTWSKDYFYCSECRRNHRSQKGPEEAAEGASEASTRNAWEVNG